MVASEPPNQPDSFHAPHGHARLDRLIASTLGCGRRRARELIDGGRVLVDGSRASKSSRPTAGSVIALLPAPIAAEEPGAITEPVLLWEGRGLLAFAKPAGLHCVHGRSQATVAAYLNRRFPATATTGQAPAEAGLVHRLDRDTSGILLAATDSQAYRNARALFRERRAIKTYLALVEGRVAGPLRIDVPLARRRARVVAAGPNDRPLEAATEVFVLDGSDRWSLVEAVTRTGVTHQVRAHLAITGHAVVGDAKYGARPAPSGTREGQLLHAIRLRLSPTIDIAAPVPVDFVRAYAQLKQGASVTV